MHDQDLNDAVESFLQARPYYRCCLLVHPDVVQLKRVGNALAARRGWPEPSIGAILGEALLPLEPVRRPSEVKDTLANALLQYGLGPLVLTDIDVLFEPALALNPLLLLRDLSRRTTLIVTWPGSYVGSTLAYAVPEHAHYRAWVRPDLCPACIVAL